MMVWPRLARGDVAPPAPIESLPSELIQLVFSFLPFNTLKEAALVSKYFSIHAAHLLWHSVSLVDTWTMHLNEETACLYTDRGRGESDEHDDTPIIHKLYILATKPEIASKVQVLTHKCHLPSPNLFSELPRIHFDAENLSQDTRIHTLLWLAVRNLVNVHTLHILYGHYNLTRILLAAFLDPKRPRRMPLRKLWLESCCLVGYGTNCTSFLDPDCLAGLESLRIRRLRVESTTNPELSKLGPLEFRLARGGRHLAMRNGFGSMTYTTVELSTAFNRPGWKLPTPEELRQKADEFDTEIWDMLPEIQAFVDSNQLPYPTPKLLPANPMMNIIQKSTSTLTSLNLDWLLWRHPESNTDDQALMDLHQLSRLRFPQLRAFQLRNAISQESRLPDNIYLFEDTFLEFMEAHPKIQCLAWPIDRFYSHAKASTNIQIRTRQVVAHLGNVLIDLRLESFYSRRGETLTDENREPRGLQGRMRRHRFICEFAPHMYKIQQLKIEGGIARDEKREIIRAVHHSPLKKLVLIGVTFPVGNTWGAHGADLKKIDPDHGSEATDNLEEEDISTILTSYKDYSPLPPDFEFRQPKYGWRAAPPLLQTIALHYANSIEELKICGYNGSPILSRLTPVTTSLLYPLRNFHNLRQLVISFWLLTSFGGSYRDSEIIQSWVDTRSPSSRALVVVTPRASPSVAPPVDPTVMPQVPNGSARHQNFNRWVPKLKYEFAPSALAYRVAADISPHLSDIAKNRPGGVLVRASFCLGCRDEHRFANDIFDLTLRIGKNGRVMEFLGPREEVEAGRYWEKLRERRWF